jgi:hypothetical protein
MKLHGSGSIQGRIFISAVVCAVCAHQSTAVVIWDGDPSGGTKVFGNLNCEGASTITAVSDPEYGLIWRFYKPSGSNRCESSHLPKSLHAQEGDEWFIGWRFKITSSVNNNAVFQWKSYPAGKQNFPVWLKHSSGKLLVVHHDVNYRGHTIWQIAAVVNTWQSVVLRLKVSRDSKIGYIEFWYNGRQQTFADGSTRYMARTLDDGYNDPKWGVYGASGTTVTNFVHALRIATTYEEAAPERPTNIDPHSPATVYSAPVIAGIRMRIFDLAGRFAAEGAAQIITSRASGLFIVIPEARIQARAARTKVIVR